MIASLVRRTLALVAAAVIGLAASEVRASENALGKHPRVVELEQVMTQDASMYLRGRFPSMPFMVTVRIDPLRRDVRRTEKNRDEDALPYYGVSDEELEDEWDNPNIGLNTLVLRIKKAKVEILVPDTLQDEEIPEIQNSIATSLQLIPARDEIRVEKRKWSGSGTPWTLIWVVAAAVLAYLAGLTLVNRGMVNRLVRGLDESSAILKKSQSYDKAEAIPSGPMPAAVAQIGGSASGGGNGKGSIRHDDPLKLRKFISDGAQALGQNPAFPTLKDLIAFDELGLSNPGCLGVILQYLPVNTREELFRLSRGKHWLDAMNNLGEIDYQTLIVLERLLAISRDVASREWEQLLIRVWRMESNDQVGFIAKLDRQEALVILASLPKGIAISIARAAFPGAWASVLDPEFHPQRPSLDRILALTEQAEKIAPRRDVGLLVQHRQVTELLDYLRTAGITEEREIYRAAPRTAQIRENRPPFFEILEATEEQLKDFVPRIPIDRWALACLNIPRGERSAIEGNFSDKQRLLYLEMLKRLDRSPPDPTEQGKLREEIARLYEIHRNAGRSAPSGPSAPPPEKASEPPGKGPAGAPPRFKIAGDSGNDKKKAA